MVRDSSVRPGANSRALAVGLLLSLTLVPLSAEAANLDVVGGQLLGASRVDVGGTLYDVEFRNGTCSQWFDGCDSVADFPFSTDSEARIASQALLDQVLIDSVPLGLFDTDPTLTNGCGSGSSSGSCYVLTPLDFRDPTGMEFVTALNRIDPLVDRVLGLGVGDIGPTTALEDGFAYAVWSRSPQRVPGPGLLVGAALLLAGISRLRASGGTRRMPSSEY